MPKNTVDKIAAGESHAAISVVNALATGKGAAIGVALRCRVNVILKDRGASREGLVIKSDFKDRHNLIETCKTFIEKRFETLTTKDKTISVLVESEIPPAVGLKSSSALAIASVIAMSKLLRKKLEYSTILGISCRVSLDSGSSVTGAYDDASACLLGGLVVTDNMKFKIFSQRRVPKSLGEIVIIRVPLRERKFTSSVDTNAYLRFRNDSLKALHYSKEGKIPEAMLLNSIVQCAALGYSFRPVFSATEEGAVAGVSGKGPAIAAICPSQKIAHSLETRWKEESKSEIEIIHTRVVQPRERN